MDTFRALEEKREKLAVVGIGYVGMPLAVEFAKKFSVIGYDISKEKVAQYRAGKDATLEVGDAVIADCGVDFTYDACRLKEAKFIVVAVPTPVNGDKTPDLTPVIAASKTVGQNLTRGGWSFTRALYTQV